ncbi:hypothetical protein [Amphibacillus cookii]|uniref:hypothetical protein n=1 Tax=Amphibacillus cookii TaxID=767787 RepID=UPI001958A44C|nr:hypothetical protein [Amphibacillus cookii]MBM7540423.1 hypothetical protein [Amphibacillus cookii]
MKILLITITLALVFHLMNANDLIGFLPVILGVIKGLVYSEKGQPLSAVFNRDIKKLKFYRNDLFEFLSLGIVFYVWFDGFSKEHFTGMASVVYTIFLVMFMYIYRSSEEKIFGR